MSWEIRVATSDDAVPLCDLAERTFRDSFGLMNSAKDMDLYCSFAFSPSIQRDELLDPGRVTLVSEHEGQLIAFAQLRRRDDLANERSVMEIDRFYVVPAWHGAGVAQEMLQRAIRCCRDSGARLLRLGVWEKNARAIRFYQKAGFVEIGEQIFLLGTDPQRDLVFQLDLDG